MIIPRVWDCIKHEAFVDICVRVLRPIIFTKTGRMVIRGEYVTMGFTTNFNPGVACRLKDWPDKWLIARDKNAPILRKTEWVYLKPKEAE